MSNTVSFTSRYALSDEQMHRLAPSIFATEPHPAVSDRYGFVPTIALVRAFREQGWLPVRAQQTVVRDESRRELTKHLIRFRQVAQPLAVGDSIAELVLVNSHDRSSAYQLDAGLFRVLCSNGMVCDVGGLAGIRVRHGKNIVDDVIEGSYEIVEEMPRVANEVERFRSIHLDQHEQGLFADAALELRYGDVQESPIGAGQLLNARRSDDIGRDLWTTLNVVQENLLRGGIRGRSRSGRRTTTRPIRSVTEDVRLNRALWRLTERFAELRGG